MMTSLGKLFERGGGFVCKILKPHTNKYRYNSCIRSRLLYVSSTTPHGLATNFTSSKSLQQSPWTLYGGLSISFVKIQSWVHFMHCFLILFI